MHPLAKAAVSVQEGLKAADFDGPKTAQIHQLLAELLQHPKLKTKTTNKPTTPRKMPAGAWNANRDRVIAFNGKVFPAPTIAKGVCKVFDTFPTFDHTELANAVQQAFPENSYKPYRVAVDLKKWAAKLFTFQQV